MHWVRNSLVLTLQRKKWTLKWLISFLSGAITICGMVINMLLKRVQRMLYNFGLPFISIAVLQTIKLFEYVGHIMTT